MQLTLIVMIPLIVVFLLTSAIVCIYLWRRKMAKTQENQRKRALRALDNEKHIKDLIDSGEFTEEEKKDIDVPFFDLESIIVATNSFSDANKLGGGLWAGLQGNIFRRSTNCFKEALMCLTTRLTRI
ncbi:G-type lectin S-receptor-like serine/threonine-protein kinase At4g03230 [Corylus avellana]|uniref:G-type lectin S-receptor-like serine/threonine-protein kinase At4g03230 n=1 Tax=Corylus avellana TaxID=13451 RepID=UPI00286A02D7|nr:G-type lectin S-receptor-like serine/threonine-protein kinase At4g03230 [Corylus avellana]